MIKRNFLVVESPKKTQIREETIDDLRDDEVLISSIISTFKHGTEMSVYHGSSSFLDKEFSLENRIFTNKDASTDKSSFYPCSIGNMTVGRVEKLGKKVNSFSVGDMVFGWLPIADLHKTSANKLKKLGKLTPKQALCIDPASFALGAVLDGDIRYGDKVLITGLGAIGLITIQYCKLFGATVYASSSFECRRKLALDYGADFILDSTETNDLGLEIKKLTQGGVDRAIECSGRYSKLHQAIRATKQCGSVVCLGFYSGGASELYLGEEFFHNRISLIASLPDWQNPVRTRIPLFREDLYKLVIQDLIGKKIKIDGLLQPKYSFENAIEALHNISKHPQTVVKILIEY